MTKTLRIVYIMLVLDTMLMLMLKKYVCAYQMYFEHIFIHVKVEFWTNVYYEDWILMFGSTLYLILKKF